MNLGPQHVGISNPWQVEATGASNEINSHQASKPRIVSKDQLSSKMSCSSARISCMLSEKEVKGTPDLHYTKDL